MKKYVVVIAVICILCTCFACGDSTAEKTHYAVTYPSQQAYSNAMRTVTENTVGNLFASENEGNEQPLGDFAILAQGKFPLLQAPDGYTVTQVTVHREGYVTFRIADTQGRAFTVQQYLHKNSDAVTNTTKPFAYYPDTVKTVSAADGTVYRAGMTYTYDGEEHILYGDTVLFWWETDGYPAFVTIEDTRILPICEQFLAEMRCCYTLSGDKKNVAHIVNVQPPSALPAPLAPPERQPKVRTEQKLHTATMSFSTVDAYVAAISSYHTTDQYRAAFEKLINAQLKYCFPEALFYDHRLTVPRFPAESSCADIQVTGTGDVTFTVTDGKTTVTLTHSYHYDAKQAEKLLTYDAAYKAQQDGYTAFTDKTGNTVYRYAQTLTFPNGTEELQPAESASYIWWVDGYVWTATANSNDGFYLLNRIIASLDYDAYALHIQ